MTDEKKEKFKIYLFRHGETTFNRDKIFTGCKEFQVAYCSHLKRSKRTLEIVLKYHKNVEVIVDDRIIERSYGDLQGMKHADFIKEHGKELFDIYHRSYDVPPPGGESIKMVEKRVYSFIRDLLEKILNEKINVAISAHGNSMRPFRKFFENLTIEEMMKLENPWDDYFEYEISPLDYLDREELKNI
ncbi:MAG: histidine phosphatase family protein [Candidatus Helarchaeota archaeon]